MEKQFKDSEQAKKQITDAKEVEEVVVTSEDVGSVEDVLG